MTHASSIPRRDLLALGLVLLALIPVVLWPGDVSWLLDEPRLIASAWHANHDRELATGGLYGNFGIRYGPLATQIYQALLLLTHDPFALIVLRGLLCAGATAFALLWLARSLELPRWFAAAALVSPHVVAYQRVLWDASFSLPIGALALAAFADFLKTGRAWSLRGCVAGCILVPMIHPQALPLALPILGWLVWRNRADLWRDRRALLILGLILLLTHGAYVVQAVGQLVARLGGSVERGYPGGASRLQTALAPFLGGTLLGGADYLENLARSTMPPWLHVAAQWCSRLIYPLAWIGILTAARRAWVLVRARALTSPREFSARDGVILVLVTGLGLQALLFGLLRIPAAPQYFFGTYALHVLAAWLAVDALRRWRVGLLLGALYGIGAAFLTLEGALAIHEHGFERPRWPTLASSVGAVRGLDSFSQTTALTDVPVYQKAPQALRTLRLLLPASTGLEPRSGQPFITPQGPASGRPAEALLVELPLHALPPPDSAVIDTTPLPKNWVPDPGTW